MKHEVLNIADAKAEFYILSNFQDINPDRKRPMAVICPGGAYSFCSGREAEAIAIRFLSFGYNAVVLFYTVCKDLESGKVLFPTPQTQLAKTISYIRQNADSLNTDKDKIFTLGFSAGGHLVASIGCTWAEYGKDCKPNAQVLCYPVISSGKYAHAESFKNLCGNNKELIESNSLEKCVNSNVPPTFIWTTKTDDSVPYQNTTLFIKALKENNIPYKSHIYKEGRHGLSLANKEITNKKHTETNKVVASWPTEVYKWLTDLFSVDFFGTDNK